MHFIKNRPIRALFTALVIGLCLTSTSASATASSGATTAVSMVPAGITQTYVGTYDTWAYSAAPYTGARLRDRVSLYRLSDGRYKLVPHAVSVINTPNVSIRETGRLVVTVWGYTMYASPGQTIVLPNRPFTQRLDVVDVTTTYDHSHSVWARF